MSAVFLFFAASALGLAWLLPNDLDPWIKVWSEAIAFAGIFLLGISVALARKQWVLQRGVLWVLCALFAVFSLSALLQWLLPHRGVVPFMADIALGYAYACALLAAVVLGQNLSPAHFKKLAALLLIFAFISALIGIMQWLRVSERWFVFIAQINSNRVYGNLNQPNLFATVCSIGLCLALYLKAQRWLGGSSCAALLAVFVLAGLLSGSRTFILQILLIAAALTVQRWRQPRTAAFLPGYLPLMLVAVMALLMWALPQLNAVLLLSEPRSLDGTASSNYARLHIYDTFIHAIGQQPWLGYGWQQQRAAHLAVVDLLPAGQTSSIFESAHNLPLDMLVTMGIPLGLAALFLFAWLLYGAAKYTIAQPKLLPLFLLLACVLLHAQLEYPLFFSFILIPFGLVLGYVLGAEDEAELKPEAAPWRFYHAWLALPAAAAFWVFAQFCSSYLALEEAYTTFRFESSNIGSIGYTSPVPDLVSPLVQQELAYLRLAQQKPSPHMAAAELAEARRVALRYPYNTVLLRYAQMQALNGQAAASADTRHRLCLIYGEKMCKAVQQDWQTARQQYPQLGAW